MEYLRWIRSRTRQGAHGRHENKKHRLRRRRVRQLIGPQPGGQAQPADRPGPAQAGHPQRPPGAGARQYPGRVRLTDFWARMRAQFGDVYAQSVAKDYVFDKLGGRTIERALADGVDAKVVWRAVVDTFDVPQRLR